MTGHHKSERVMKCPQQRTQWLGIGLALVLGGAALWPTYASADELRLRHAHTFDRYEDGGYRRVGVAMLALPGGRREPATLDLRGSLTGAQGDGWFGMRVTLRYRFDDGSTIEGRMEGRFRRSDMGEVSGPQEATGELTGGSGRFQGIQGRFTMAGAAGLSVLSPGVMAEVYGDLIGEYSLPTRP